MGLIANTDVKTFLSIPSANTDDDSLLTALIVNAQGMADMDTNRTLEVTSADATDYYDGDGSSVLLVKRYPIVSITTIHDDIDRDYGADCLISSDDYFYHSAQGRIMLDGSAFNKSEKNIKVVYKGGYSSSTIPGDLKLALILLTAYLYLLGKGSVNAIEGIPSGRVDKLVTRANDILAKYKDYSL